MATADDPEVLNAAISGVTTIADIVAAVAGHRIVVHAIVIGLTAAGTVQLHSAATALSGAITLGTGIPLMLSHPKGVLKTAVGEALRLTCTTGTGAGWVRYSLAR